MQGVAPSSDLRSNGCPRPAEETRGTAEASSSSDPIQRQGLEIAEAVMHDGRNRNGWFMATGPSPDYPGMGGAPLDPKLLASP
jgi:hypothetical protein